MRSFFMTTVIRHHPCLSRGPYAVLCRQGLMSSSRTWGVLLMAPGPSGCVAKTSATRVGSVMTTTCEEH